MVTLWQGMNIQNKIKHTIAFVFPSMRIGGVEKKILHLSNYLKRNFNIILICLEAPADMVEEFNRLGVKIIYLNKKYKYDIRIIYKLNKIFNIVRPLIVHTFLGGNYWGRFSALLSGVPYIIGNEDSLRYWQRKMDKYIFQILYRFTDVIVCNSKAIKTITQKLTNTDDSKYVIIPNGFTVRSKISFDNIMNIHHNKTNSKIRLLSVGRLEWRKGYLEILKVIKDIVESGTLNFVYFIVGDGPQAGIIKKYISNNKLDKNIVLTGALKDIENIYLKSDLFIHVPVEEGFGIVLLEAMYFCLPIITTKVGGIPEVLPKDKNQILLVNDVSSNHVYKLITNYIHNYDIDKNGILINRLHSEKYLWENVSKIYINMYKQLIYRRKYIE